MVRAMAPIREELIKEARRTEEDGLYSARSHFEAARLWANTHYVIGVPAGIAAAISGVLALSNQELIAGILAIFVAAAAATATVLDPSAKANAHHRSGTSFNALRNRARIFYNIDCGQGTDEELVAKLRELADERDRLNQESPQIPRWAYRLAKKGIERGEARHLV